jgi:ankyrin repeat protein
MRTACFSYVDVTDGLGWSSLHYAALAGRLGAVRTLLSHGANIIARTQLHNFRVEL